MKSQHSSSSFALPSDLDNDNISDKEVDSFRHQSNTASGQSQKKPPNIPNLDLSFPGDKDKRSIVPASSKKQSNNNVVSKPPLLNYDDALSIVSPILSQEHRDLDKQGGSMSPLDNVKVHNNHKLGGISGVGSQTRRIEGGGIVDATTVGAGSNKSNQHQYRRMETDKTAPQSNLKTQMSPDRNPQSQFSQYNQNASVVDKVSDFNNGQSQNGKSIDNATKSDKRDPSGQTNTGAPELTLDEESYERERFNRGGSLQKEGAELFNDSLVSAIEQSGIHQFMDDPDEEDEDTSARRLIPDNQIQRRNNHQPQQQQPQNHVGDRAFNQTKGNSTVGQNLTKDLINFVDQSKEDVNNRHNKMFPILHQETQQHQKRDLLMLTKMSDKRLSLEDRPQPIEFNKYGYKSNKVAPINTNNFGNLKLKKRSNEEVKELGTDDDYFQFDELKQNQEKQEALKNFKQSLFANSSNEKDKLRLGNLRINTQGSSKHKQTTGEDGNESEQERSCLLDESQLKKQLNMPNLQGNKIQLQADIGYIIQKDEVKFHEELIQNNPDDSFYRIVDKDSIEIIEAHTDKCPCLNIRKSLWKIRVYTNRAALIIITNSFFETVSIMVIIANSLFLALEDPMAVEPPVYSTYSDLTFQALYTLEMVLKILALGFVLNKGSYLRDSWNILDFVIVVSGYFGYIMSGGGANLSVLRSFRVIRPLRTISSVEGLRIIVSALVSSLPLLRDTILVLIFFFVIFAIAGKQSQFNLSLGVQLFTGELKNRCFMIETGVKDIGDILCAADENCLPGRFCGKGNENPNLGATSFDNVFYAMLLIFQTVTLEGWTANMIDLEEAVATWVIVYFVPIIFIGAFFLLNLTLAVIKSKFTEEMKKTKETKVKSKKSKIKKKKGVDDDSDNENNQDGDLILKQLAGANNEDIEAFKEKIEGMTIQQIEENKDLSQDQKKEIKAKRKLEELLKKMEIAIKQKEVKEKITPRGEASGNSSSGLYQSKLKFSSMEQDGNNYAITQLFQYPNYGELFQNKSTVIHDKPQITDFTDKFVDTIQSPLLENPDSQLKLFKSQQRTATFKLKAEETIKEDEEEYHDLTIILDENNNPVSLIDNRKSKSDLKINKMLGIQGIKKSQIHNDKKQSISSWLGQVFEIENYKDNAKGSGKVMMSGIAGIKSLKMGESQELDERKKAAYQRLQQNFDIFEFLDDEQFGDDELSNDDQPLENEDNDGENMIDEEMNNHQNGVNHGIKPLDRKSTVATAETKSFTKRNTLQRRSSRDNFQSDKTAQDLILNSQHTETQPQNGQGGKKGNSQDKNKFKRRQTVIAKHGGYVDQEEEKYIKQESKKKTFKQKALSIFKRSNALPKVIQAKPKLDDSSAQSSFNNTVNQFKESFSQSKRASKSAPRNQTSRPSSPQTQPYSQLINEPESSNSHSLIDQNATVRAKSEHLKRKKLHKDTIIFRQRNDLMKERRNQFFADSIRHIGKSKLQIKKAKNERILKKRLIQLGGGFQLVSPESPKYRKRKFLRSGTFELPKDFVEDKLSQLSQAQQLDIPKLQTIKTRFIDDEMINEIKAIKEEVKKEEQEEEQIPDMEQILIQKKKKISLKLKNYKFSSVHDIFEGRDQKQKLAAQLHGKEDQKEQLKKQLNEEKKKQKAQVKQNKIIVKPFEKKIKLQSKKYHEDLEEMKDSDDNQDDALKKLEDLYNKTHKSDIHVTGTLSIVFEKPKHENKMMNINYYYNIHPQQFINPQKYNNMNNVSGKNSLDNTKQNMYSGNPNLNSGNNNNIFIGGFGEVDRLESKESMYDHNISMGSLGQGSVLMRSQENSARHHLPRNYSQNKVSPNVSRRSNIPQSAGLGKRRGPLRRTTTGVQGSKDRRSLHGNSTGFNRTINAAALPRPEIMSDRQILRRLNDEVKKSKLFQSINFKKLPDTIRRKDGELEPKKKLRKIPKKKPNPQQQNGKQPQVLDEEEISDTSQEKDLDLDFFLDRKLNNFGEVQIAKQQAAIKVIDKIEWSGQDIMTKFDPYKARIALESLNKIRVWPKGFYGYFKRARTTLKKIMKHSLMENFMTLCVFANTIILSMDHYGIDPETQAVLGTFNTCFTIIFTCEMGLKIMGIGIVKWLNDKMNYMDGSIVIMSLVELIFLSGNGALSAFRSVRMFRTLRVLRVARLLRGLKSMMNILAVIQRSLSSFVYLGMLLFLFIFIYALLGMQLFGGQFESQKGTSRYNFDSFNQAFVTSFILLTMENWNTILFYAMASDVNKGISVIYFISCIFVGNFMLLNLFLAILLDAFTTVDEEDHETEEKKALREKQQKDALNEKQGEDLILGIDDVDMNQHEHDAKGKNKKKKKKKKKLTETQNNILDESIEIDMEALTEKKEQTFKEKSKLFEGVACERSLYIFPKDNKIRIWSYKIAQNTKFETVILVLIILSSLKLIYDTYLFDAADDDLRVVVSSQMDLIFTILFTGECVMKCIAYGFIQDTNSYLRETWSQMDFFIVVTSLIDAMFSGVNIPIIKILRLLRILRPLRFISHNSSMKTVVIALLSSMGAIFNVGIVVICVFLMFAILGVNLFAGKLQYCTVNKYLIDNKLECFKVRGEWKTYSQNFDNVIVGMLTLFSVATLEGWPEVMYTYTDMTLLEMGPKPAASPLNAYFFVGFVFVGAFFFMNLFVGVLFMNFEAAQRDEKEALLLEGSEIKWVDMMKMILDAKPDIIKIPNNRLSKALYHFTKPESKFDFFIMICIILNMFQMAILFEGQTVEYQFGLDIANYFFTSIFTLECVLKLIGNGSAYFIPTWHKFDFFVVFSSFIDIAMGQLSSTSLKFLRVGPQLARVLRVLRVSRLFRLLNKYKGLQALLQTITFSLPSLFNVFALLMLVYFIFAVLGVFMFRTITEGVIIDPEYMNFFNFSQAMIILLRISTGEDWPTIMYDTMNTSEDCIAGKNCGSDFSPLFFIIFVMICSYVMLNLFVLIILQQFELYYLPNDNILQQFRTDLETFKITWQEFSKQHSGIRIRSTDLVDFYKKLGGNLGFGHSSDQEIIRNIVKMNLESDEEGFIYFNELLFKAMKRRYGSERTKKKILIDFELKTLEKLMKMKEKMITKQRGIERIKAVTYNPFLAVMYKNMSFRAWNKIFKGGLDKRKDEQEFGIDRESSDEEEQQRDLGDYDYEYQTEEDVSCDEDEGMEEEQQDNSQKHLLGDKSVNALIQDLNITPSESQNSQVQVVIMKNPNLNNQETPKKNYIEIEDQNPSPESKNYNSGFKIKLQSTEQIQNQKLSLTDVKQRSPYILNTQEQQKFFPQEISEPQTQQKQQQEIEEKDSSSENEAIDKMELDNNDNDNYISVVNHRNDEDKNYSTTDPLQKE